MNWVDPFMNPLRIYIIAGESSGDAHASVLMGEIGESNPEILTWGAHDGRIVSLSLENLPTFLRR